MVGVHGDGELFVWLYQSMLTWCITSRLHHEPAHRLSQVILNVQCLQTVWGQPTCYILH